MAVETIPVAELKSRLSFVMTNSATVPTSPIDLGTEFEWALEWALRSLVSKTTHPSFRVETTLTADAQDKDLPDDFWRMIEPGPHFTSDPKYPLVYYEEQDRVRLGWTHRLTTTDRPRYWTLRGRDDTSGLQQIRFVPTPDVGYSITYTYLAIPQRVVGATNLDPRFPRDKVELLVWASALQLPQYLSQAQLALATRRYEELIVDFQSGKSPVVGYSAQRNQYTTISPSYTEPSWPTSISGTPYHT